MASPGGGGGGASADAASVINKPIKISQFISIVQTPSPRRELNGESMERIRCPFQCLGIIITTTNWDCFTRPSQDARLLLVQ